MPSWGMHLGVANKVADKIDVIDKNLFLIGNVLPDINNGYVVKGISKTISHKITHYDGEKDFKNYRKFYLKYNTHLENPMILGSLVHLMTDYYYNNLTYQKKSIWSEEKNVIQLQLNTGKKIECDKETARKMKTNDFKIFANYIYENINLQELYYDQKALLVNNIIKEMEVTSEDIEKTIEYLNEHISRKRIIINDIQEKEYKIFTREEMLESLELCADFIVNYLNKIRKITVGKTAGFCYGVKRAVNGAKEEIRKNKEQVYCLGEIVHNKQVVESLEKDGLIFIEDIEEAKGKTILRAHGVAKEVYGEAEKEIELQDYTCPNVLKIHKIVEKYSKNGYYIFLCGSKKHPENIGTLSYCKENSYVIEKEDDTMKALEKLEKTGIKKLLIISQTTYSLEKFYIIEEIVKNELPKDVKLVVKNTICMATELRQKETEKLSKQVDYMIIIGGKNSSNTKKLYDIAKNNCKDSICIETAKDLEIINIQSMETKTLGIMAGASTPQESIDEVLKKLTE